MKTIKRLKQTIEICAYSAMTNVLLATPVLAESNNRITKIQFSALTDLLVNVATWIFGISGLLLGVIAIKRGLEIAASEHGPRGKAMAMDKMGRLLVGASVCFGAWLIVGVIKGLFE